MKTSKSELHKMLQSMVKLRLERFGDTSTFADFWNSIEESVLQLSKTRAFDTESDLYVLMHQHLSRIFTKEGLLRRLSAAEQAHPHLWWRSDNYNFALLRKWNAKHSVQMPDHDDQERKILDFFVVHSDPAPEVGSPEKRIYRLSDPPIVFNHPDVPTINFEFTFVSEQRGNRNRLQSQQNMKSVEQILRALEACSEHHILTRLNEHRDWLKNQIDFFSQPGKSDFLIHDDFTSHARRNLDIVLSQYLFDRFNQTRLSGGNQEFLSGFHSYHHLLQSILTYFSETEERCSFLHEQMKYVLSSHYCIGLANVPDSFISECLLNDSQLSAWSEQLHVPLETVATREFLVNNKSLVIDTTHFSEEFQARLLSELGNLDTAFPGLVVQGDNADVLRLLHNRYKEEVDLIYVDPPYNTGERSFAYKDSYPHSDWLSMLNERLKLARNLLAPSGGFYVSINESELYHLKKLCDAHFGHQHYLGNIAVKVRHPERVLKADKHIQEVLEYLLIYQKSRAHQLAKRTVDNSNIDAYHWQVELTGDPVRKIDLGNKSVRIYSPDAYRLKKRAPSTTALKRINIRGTLRESNSSGRFYVNHVEPLKSTYPDHLFCVQDMGNDAHEFRCFWLPGPDSKRKNGDYFQGVPLNFSPVKLRPFPNFWDFMVEFNRATYQGGLPFRNGKKPLGFLARILELAGLHDKPNAVVLDFFGGSGSTAHAVLALNEFDGGSRRFILAEAGAHFDGTLKPRLINAMTSTQWSRKGPEFPLDGIASGFQVIRLASIQTTAHSPGLSGVPLQSPDVVSVKHQMPGMAKNETSVVNLVDNFNLLVGLRNRHCSRIYSFAKERPVSGALNPIPDGEVKCQFQWGETESNQTIAILWGWYTGIPDVDLEFARHWISVLMPDVFKQPVEKLYLNGLTESQIGLIDSRSVQLCQLEARLVDLMNYE